MKNYKKKHFAFSFLILTFLVGCGGDSVAPTKSRDIKFEVTGNFTGDIDATYTTESGGTTIDGVTSLPWVKNITYVPSVLAVSMNAGGGGGVAGQTLTIKIFAGTYLISTTSGTANIDGIVIVVAPTYTF